MPRELNVLVLVKGGHRFVFVYDDESVQTLRQVIVDTALDPQTHMDLRDAEELLDRLDQGG